MSRLGKYSTESFVPIIEEWITSSPQGHITYAWSTAMDAGLNAQSSWSDVKTTMNINTFCDYYHSIANSTSITKKVKLKLDNTSGVIHYWLLETQPNTITPLVHNQSSTISENNLDLPDLNASATITDLNIPNLNMSNLSNMTKLTTNPTMPERSQISSGTNETTTSH